jgi:hypothetical protein
MLIPSAGANAVPAVEVYGKADLKVGLDVP